LRNQDESKKGEVIGFIVDLVLTSHRILSKKLLESK